MSYYNKNLLDKMSAIDSMYTNSRVYAQSMHDYVSSKCDILNTCVNDLLIASQSVGHDELPFSPKLVLIAAIERISGAEYGTPEFQDIWDTFIVSEGTPGADGPLHPRPFFEDTMNAGELFSSDAIPEDVLNAVMSHLGDVVPSFDTMCDWIDTYRQMTYYQAGLISEADSAIVTAGSKIFKSVADVEDYVGTAATQTQTLLAALQTAADEPEDITEYVTSLVSESKEAAGSISGQQILEIARKCGNNIPNMVNTMVNTVSVSAQTTIDSLEEAEATQSTDGTFASVYTIGNYTDKSAWSLFCTELNNSFKTIANGFIKVMKAAWTVVKAVVGLGVTIVKGLLKPITSLFRNPMITINDNAPKDDNTFDFPFLSLAGSTYQMNRLDYLLGPYNGTKSVTDIELVQSILGQSGIWTEDCLRYLLRNNNIVKMDYHFGSFYIGKTTTRSIPFGSFNGSPVVDTVPFDATFDPLTGKISSNAPPGALEGTVVEHASEVREFKCEKFKLETDFDQPTWPWQKNPLQIGRFYGQINDDWKFDVDPVIAQTLFSGEGKDVLVFPGVYVVHSWLDSNAETTYETLDYKIILHKKGELCDWQDTQAVKVMPDNDHTYNQNDMSDVEVYIKSRERVWYTFENPRWEPIIIYNNKEYVLIDYERSGNTFTAMYGDYAAMSWDVLSSLRFITAYPCWIVKQQVAWPGNYDNVTIEDYVKYICDTLLISYNPQKSILENLALCAWEIDESWTNLFENYADFHDFIAAHGGAIETIDFRCDIYVSPTKPLRGDYAYDNVESSLITFRQNCDLIDGHATLNDELNSLFPEDEDIRLVLDNDTIEEKDNIPVFVAGMHASIYRMFVMTILRSMVFTMKDVDPHIDILNLPWFFKGNPTRPILSTIHMSGSEYWFCSPYLDIANDGSGINVSWTNEHGGYTPGLKLPASCSQWIINVFDTLQTHYDEWTINNSMRIIELLTPYPGTMNVNLDMYVQETDYIISALHFLLSVHVALITSNQPKIMKQLLYERGEFPSFVPYVNVQVIDQCRYHLRTYAEMNRKAKIIAMGLAAAITVAVVVAGVIAAKFLIKRGLRGIAEKLANSTEANKYVYQDIVAAYQQGTTYTFIEAGTYNNVSKQMYTWAEYFNSGYSQKLVDDATFRAIEQVYDGDSDSVTIDYNVDPVVDKEIYTFVSKNYVNSVRRDRLKTSLIAKCGGNAYSYNVYDDLLWQGDDEGASVEDVAAATDDIEAQVDLDPVTKLIKG